MERSCRDSLFSVPIATIKQQNIIYLLYRVDISLVVCGAYHNSTPHAPVSYEMHTKPGVLTAEHGFDCVVCPLVLLSSCPTL